MSRWISKSYIGLVMAFLYVPIFVLIAFSFSSSKGRATWGSFTFKWYEELLHNDAIISALVTTLIVAFVSSIAATIIGTAAAIGIHNMRNKARILILNATYLPVISPEIIMGVSLMLLFVLLKIEFGLFTLILAHITFNLPYVILSVLPKLRQMDRYIFDAAMDLGCTPVQAFMKVTVPEIMPGIVTGFLIALTFSLDDFNISYFVSGNKSQTLPILIYSMTRKKVSPEINALSAIIFAIVLTVLIIANVHAARREKALKKAIKNGELMPVKRTLLGTLSNLLTRF